MDSQTEPDCEEMVKNKPEEVASCSSTKSTCTSDRAKEHKYSCGVCNLYKTDVKSNFIRHTKRHDGPTITCDKCVRTFTDTYEMKRHRNSHDGESYLCHVCCRQFYSHTGLSAHIRVKHPASSSSVIKCPECGIIMYTKNDLKGHMNTHEGIGKHMYKCEECLRTYSHKKSLDRHKLNCNQTSMCNVCYKSFTTVQILKEHIEGKHEEKKYICPCGKIFSWRQSYLRHVKQKGHSSKALFCDLDDD